MFAVPGFLWAGELEESADPAVESAVADNISSAVKHCGGTRDDADYVVSGFIFHDRDRYQMARFSAQEMNDGVIIVSGENFPDALSASGLAGLLGYPIIYTPSNGVGDDALAWVSEHHVHNVLIIGGEAAVSKEMECAVEDISTVTGLTRIAGSDRFETADAVYRYGASVHGWEGSNAVVVSGAGFADAASVAVYAAREAAPVFLADAGGLLSDRFIELASSFSHVLVAGGDAAVSDASVIKLSSATSVDQFAGVDRYDTSAKLCAYLTTLGDNASVGQGEFSYGTIYFATGSEFADALAYGVNEGVCARWNARGSESAPVIFLVDDGRTSYALDVLRSVGTYCVHDEWYNINRFSYLGFIGSARFAGTSVIRDLAYNGFGVWCDFDDGQL